MHTHLIALFTLSLAAAGCSQTAPSRDPLSAVTDPAAMEAPLDANLPMALRTVAASDPADPHAGHNHGTAPQAADPHAGHNQGAASQPADPHAGHNHGAEATTYVCPMHPEVASDKPGTCPKCNMKLSIKAKAPAKGAS